MKYTTSFKKAVLRKVLPPENRSVHSVSVEVGVGEMTIHRWIAQVKDGKTYFLVAHNGIARAVNSYFFDMTNEDYGNFGIKNCEILEYQFNK